MVLVLVLVPAPIKLESAVSILRAAEAVPRLILHDKATGHGIYWLVDQDDPRCC